jgi:hypothetical protein
MSSPVPQRILLGFCILLLAGCATYNPNPDPNASFIQRAQIKESGRLRVSVGVPTRAEAKAYLGVDVERHKIQPIWVRVENSEDDEFVLLPLSADPDYFSPAEAAWKNHKEEPQIPAGWNKPEDGLPLRRPAGADPDPARRDRRRAGVHQLDEGSEIRGDRSSRREVDPLRSLRHRDPGSEARLPGGRFRQALPAGRDPGGR